MVSRPSVMPDSNDGQRSFSAIDWVIPRPVADMISRSDNVATCGWMRSHSSGA